MKKIHVIGFVFVFSCVFLIGCFSLEDRYVIRKTVVRGGVVFEMHKDYSLTVKNTNAFPVKVAEFSLLVGPAGRKCGSYERKVDSKVLRPEESVFHNHLYSNVFYIDDMKGGKPIRTRPNFEK